MSVSTVPFPTVDAVESSDPKTVLVTGGAGFIGSHLVEALLLQGYSVVVVDNFNSYYDPTIKRKRIAAQLGSSISPSSPSLPAVPPRLFVFEIDIRNYNALRNAFDTYKPRYVFHLAAQAGVRWCSDHLEETMSNNVEGTNNVLKCSSEVGTVTRVLFASSSTVYGNQPTPWQENATLQGLGLYAQSKVLGEFGCRNYPSLRITILRLFSVYGPNSRPDMAVSAFMERLHQRMPITIFGDGSQARDNTYITDVVKAFLLAANRPILSSNIPVGTTAATSNVEIFNVGTSNPTSLTQMLSILQEEMKRVPARIKYEPRKHEDACITHANTERAKQVLGFEAQVDPRTGIKRCVDAYRRTQPVFIAAVVATRNRLDLLTGRCLPAIFAQERLPDSVTIVDDSQNPSQLQDIQEWIKVRCQNESITCRVNVVPNTRTKGASGAWNTGAHSVTALAKADGVMMHNVYVAVCDDDDQWEPSHLRLCEATVRATGCDMAVPGIIRHEFDESDTNDLLHQSLVVREQSISLSLSIDDFLIGNPHVQGSNMFIRLDAFAQAGMFDEYLSACTDRDLLIRLLELPGFLYAPVEAHTVHHYAEKNRQRMSSPLSDSKQRGLDYFFQKHCHRMSEDVKSKCLERAFKFFAWRPSATAAPQPASLLLGPVLITSSPSMGAVQGAISKCSLIVGITSDGNSHKIEPLLQDIANLQHSASDFLCGIDVVVLENGPREPDVYSSPLAEAVQRVQRSTGLRCMFISLEQQVKDIASGALPSFLSNDPQTHRAPIAETRTSVQYYAAALAHKKSNGPVVWILDDDKRLGPDFAVKLRQLFEYRTNHPNLAVVFGSDTSSPPLPTAFVVRCQMVDIVNNLQRVAASLPKDQLTDRSHENEHMRRVKNDYFHDLASNGGVHLEYPFWFPTEGLSSVQALCSLADQLDGILSGSIPLRQPEAQVLGQGTPPELQFVPSVTRGGCTFIFDPSCLTEVVNYVPVLGGVRSRRSDMIWSAVNLYVRDKTVVQCNQISVTHERSGMQDKQAMMEVALQDIFGHALYTAFVALVKHSRSLAFTDTHARMFIQEFTEALNTRKVSLSASLERIRGLSSIILRVLQKPDHWWNQLQSNCAEQLAVSLALDKFQLLAATVENRFDSQWESQVLRKLTISPEIQANLVNWLKFMSNMFNKSRENFYLPEHVEAFKTSLYEPFRIQSARISIAQSFSDLDPSSLEFIGIDHEGVTFHLKDTDRAFKYMDLFAVTASADEESFLAKINSEAQRLLRIVQVKRNGTHLIIEKGFVSGAHLSMENKHLADTPLTLLLQCRQAQISFKNVKPDNILVSDSDGSLVLVDVGRDVTAWSEENEKSMARKLYLTWTWLHREDLTSILSKSVSVRDENPEELLPELEGFANFWLAFQHMQDPYLAQSDLFGIITSMVMQTLRRTQTQSKPIATVFSRDVGRFVPSESVGSCLSFTTSIDDLGSGYDTVVCSRVLCCVDDIAAQEILRSITAKLSLQGEAIISVCNPFFITLGSTPHQQRHIKASDNPRTCFSYTKKVATGTVRTDYSRPFHVLRSMLFHAGLHITDVQQTQSADVRNFRANSDYLILRVRHVIPTSAVGSSILHQQLPDCALLIKSCFMEHDSIYQSVVHLVKQLEGPRAFAERVLVVDSRKQGFTRQYAEVGPDEVSSFTCQAEQLLQEHWIDRVLFASNDPRVVEPINRLWFGQRGCTATHAENGAPISSMLQAITESKCDLILQVDSDLMIGRRSHVDDYISQTWRIFQEDSEAITVSLDICHNHPGNPSFDDANGPHRVEVRGCLFLKSRMIQRLPIPSGYESKDSMWTKHSVNGSEISIIPTVGWYRFMDAAISKLHWGRSYRLNGGNGTFFVHPQNPLKKDKHVYGLTIDCVEKLRIPDSQIGQVDAIFTPTGTSLKASNNWQQSIPTRGEDFVFIICGRNVNPDKLLRCATSLKRQQWKQWLKPEMYPNQPEKDRRISCSSVVIDDCSDSHVAEFIQLTSENSDDTWGMPVTLVQPRFRRFIGSNNVLAIRHICNNPHSIIVTLDMDDALIGTNVITTLAQAYYEQHVDVTVGNMLRTDKKLAFNYEMTVKNPRQTRGGGNVWKHLRSFRKYLFDRIEDQHLRTLSKVNHQGLSIPGEYYTFANDWSFMLPIIEMSFRPMVLTQDLYLYDAVAVATEDEHALTELAVTEIVRLPSYSKVIPMIAVVGDASLDLFSNTRSSLTDEVFSSLTQAKIHHLRELGRRLIDEGYHIVCGGMDGAMKEVCIGAHLSSRYKQPGCTVGLLPGSDRLSANPFVDVVIPTNLNHARNVLVAQADAVISVGGGSGTMSEIAASWAQGRLVIGIPIVCRPDNREEGESESLNTTDRLVGTALDSRSRGHNAALNQIHSAKDANDAVHLLQQYLPLYQALNCSQIKSKL